MFAGKRNHRRAQASQNLFGCIELVGPCQMRDVAGVHDELRLPRQRVDAVDDAFQRSGNVRIGGLMKADVAVADLNEKRRVGQTGGANDTSGGQRVRNAGTGPTDVLEKIAALHFVTTTLPCMYGWIAQKYANVPGVAKRCVQESPVSRPLESNVRSTAVTVCPSVSSLTNRTVVPAGTVTLRGTYAKSLMCTTTAGAGATGPAAEPTAEPAPSATIATKNKTLMPLLCATGSNGSPPPACHPERSRVILSGAVSS